MIEFYNYFGMPGKVKILDNKCFLKTNFFLYKKSHIPVTYYNDYGK